jgi:hypothetical protein
MIRIGLPYHLRLLGKIDGEVELDVVAPVTTRAILDALENRYPMLRDTIRDHVTAKRRPFIRFTPAMRIYLDSLMILSCSHRFRAEPFLIIGIAGG